VVDVTGEVLASTSRWSRVAACDLSLDRELFHTDMQMGKIAQIQARYGADVVVKTYTEEHLVLIESLVPGLSVRDIMDEFELVSYRDYITRCTDFRTRALELSLAETAG
jgi:hypothetical protein